MNNEVNLPETWHWPEKVRGQDDRLEHSTIKATAAIQHLTEHRLFREFVVYHLSIGQAYEHEWARCINSMGGMIQVIPRYKSNSHVTLQKTIRESEVQKLCVNSLSADSVKLHSKQTHFQKPITTLSPPFGLRTKMCTTKHFKSRNCEHKWLEIDTPCGYGKGFSTCSSFHGGTRARAAACPTFHSATKSDCPWHGLKGNYDFNYVRMVEGRRYGLGFPAGEGERVMRIVCCSVM